MDGQPFWGTFAFFPSLGTVPPSHQGSSKSRLALLWCWPLSFVDNASTEACPILLHVPHHIQFHMLGCSNPTPTYTASLYSCWVTSSCFYNLCSFFFCLNFVRSFLATRADLLPYLPDFLPLPWTIPENGGDHAWRSTRSPGPLSSPVLSPMGFLQADPWRGQSLLLKPRMMILILILLPLLRILNPTVPWSLQSSLSQTFTSFIMVCSYKAHLPWSPRDCSSTTCVTNLSSLHSRKLLDSCVLLCFHPSRFWVSNYLWNCGEKQL